VHHGLDLHSPESAAQWLLSEQANLAALVRLVQRERLRPYAWQLPHALAGSYQRQGLWEMWLSSHRSALDLMPDHSDPPRHAVLCGLGIAHAQLNQLSAARDCFTRALELCDPTGDVEPRARYVTNLGGVAYQLGQFEQALNLFREGLHLRSGEGDGSSAATSTTNVGIALSALGRTAEAKALLEQALAVFRQTGDVGAEIHVMIALGDACARVAPAERTRWYNSAITSARGIGDRFHEADALQSLGHALPAGQGAVHLRQALKIFQQLGHPRATMVANELAGRRGTNRLR
jgi:tetratricopeptide (TPR) repeat protein